MLGDRTRHGRYIYYGDKVAIQATVREAATGVSQNATETETKIVRETTKLEFLSTPTDFKPGMPFVGKVRKICHYWTNEKLVFLLFCFSLSLLCAATDDVTGLP